jgi:CheY-like chemotaxis protein
MTNTEAPMRILVVDDDPLNLQFLSDLLQSRGYEVVTAQDGEHAWQIQQQPAAPQLLIVDWMLPRLSGPELCRRIRAQERDVRAYIILVTGHNPSERIHEGLASGADDFLAKPYHPKVLLSHVAVGVRQLHAGSQPSDRVRKTLADASQLGSCDVMVRGHEASGRICFQNGGVIWADLSNDRESLFERLVQESGGAIGTMLSMLERYPSHHRDDSGERVAMGFAEFAEFRSTIRAWIRRKVSQILSLTMNDIRIVPVPGRREFPGNLELPLSEVLPDSAAPIPSSQSSQVRRLFSTGAAAPELQWEQTFPSVEAGVQPPMRSFVSQLMAVRGARGAALLQLHQNGCLLRQGTLGSCSPLLGALHVVKELYVQGQGIGSLSDAAPDLIVCSGSQTQLLQVIPCRPPIAALLVLDSATSTLAMARHQLQQCAQALLRSIQPSAAAGTSSAELVPASLDREA